MSGKKFARALYNLVHFLSKLKSNNVKLLKFDVYRMLKQKICRQSRQFIEIQLLDRTWLTPSCIDVPINCQNCHNSKCTTAS